MDHLLAWLEHWNVDFDTVLETAAVLVAAAIVILVVTRVIRQLLRRVEAWLSLPYEAVVTIMRIVTTVLWLLTGLLVLNVWGVKVGGLWTVLVSAATLIGVGFLATWAMVSNVTATFFITLWRPFQLGSTVEMLPENLKGRVVDRNLMFTVLREESGSVLHIPNNLFFQRIFRVSGGHEQYLFEFLQQPDRAGAPQPVAAPAPVGAVREPVQS
jgi:small-conductance mechanosensitive channel